TSLAATPRRLSQFPGFLVSPIHPSCRRFGISYQPYASFKRPTCILQSPLTLFSRSLQPWSPLRRFWCSPSSRSCILRSHDLLESAIRLQSSFCAYISGSE
ncbi:hypothetical protein CONPUDRAFT_167610, partial [Coniophora puteana RWD-64-598 SS2]